jgi:polyhydroxyalkanoate synthesis regulator phasin
MDPLKKFLYAGVDLVADTSEKFTKTVHELVDKGNISSTEGKKLVDEWFEKAETAKQEFEHRVKEISQRLGVTEKNEEEELEQMRKRVADLESKLGKSHSTKREKASAV